MKLKNAQTSVAVVALALMSACVNIDGKGNNDSSARERVTTQSLAGSIAPIFSVTGGGAALKLKASHDESGESSLSCLEEDVSEEGLTLSNDVPDGHYGLSSGGVDIEGDTTCEETGFLHWELDDVTGEDCAGDEMEISGEGVVGFGTTEDGEAAVVVLGSFTVEGLDVTCDIIVTGDTFSASCEVEGEALEADSCGASDDGDEETSDEDSEWDSDDAEDEEEPEEIDEF